MKNNIKEAREARGYTAVELGEKLNVHFSTINHWEAGRRQIPPEKLVQLADILGFTVDYLLGRNIAQTSLTEPVDKDALITLHGQPVWTVTHGWMLVNTVKESFVLNNLSLLQFNEIQENIFLIPPTLFLGLRGVGKPLSLESVLGCERMWVEPITPYQNLADALRGWYRLHESRLVQNEFGNRFYLDAYGVKWLAFKNCIE